MQRNKGIGVKLGILVIFITFFVIGMSSFTWKNFEVASAKNQKNLSEVLIYNQIIDDVRQTQVNFKIQVQEWKNVLIRGHKEEDFAKHYGAFSKQQENIQKQLKALKESMTQLEFDINLIDELIQTHQKLYEEYNQAIKSYNAENVNSYWTVDALVRGIDRKATTDMDQLVIQIQELTYDRIDRMVEQESADIKAFNIKLLVISIVSIVIVIIFALFIIHTYKNIIRFILELNRVMEKASQGDLTVRGRVLNKDELSAINIKFNGVLDNIQELLKEGQEISDIVARSSYKVNRSIADMGETSQVISHTMMEITQGATEQSSQVRDSHESMVKIVAGIDQVVSHMIESESQVRNTEEVVSKGIQTLMQQRNKMSDTKDATQRVDVVIKELKLKSKEIGEVVIFINNITEQINLLSLNASIEAARAGEAGRGFTVVAEEIKKLADLSKRHTGTIGQLMSDVQRYIQDVDHEVYETQHAVDQQEISLKSIEEVFEMIRYAIEKVAYQAKEVTQQTSSMHEAMGGMQKAMSGITEVIENTAHKTEENMTTMEEQTASIEEIEVAMNYLSEQAAVLGSIIEKFKVK